jgi:hypothetical protein
VNTRESGLEPWPLSPSGHEQRPDGSLEGGRYATSVFNGTNGLPKSNDDLSWPNYGINPTNPTHSRVSVSEGRPEMVVLKMAVDGTPIVPTLSR